MFEMAAAPLVSLSAIVLFERVVQLVPPESRIVETPLVVLSEIVLLLMVIESAAAVQLMACPELPEILTSSREKS